jgi:hypothetical protein
VKRDDADPALSPWFCALTHPPVRPGWYQTRNAPTGPDTRIAVRRYWDGMHWSNIGCGKRPSAFGTWTEFNQWRGVLR